MFFYGKTTCRYKNVHSPFNLICNTYYSISTIFKHKLEILQSNKRTSVFYYFIVFFFFKNHSFFISLVVSESKAKHVSGLHQISVTACFYFENVVRKCGAGCCGLEPPRPRTVCLSPSRSWLRCPDGTRLHGPPVN